ncbi:F-box/LRR-repeat protein 25-like [Zingiber officinale]|uniref:F-box/LRR-repeat protein 25-like n=1 Tax=Zingiber officinale TaxID=94328 RepID=UPI001C4CD9B2|nr:F-box/LRR-repeat protein 25-like [Zingiber officinale]
MDDLSSRRRRFRRHLLSSKGEEDYLSNLPDELLIHILSFLPTLDSIRTSVLSRRWRHVWTSVPVIDFSYLQLKSTMIKRFFASRGDESASRLRLSGPSFNCDFNCESSMSRDILICTMVDYAKSHDARHVTLLRFFFQYLSDCFFDQLFVWPSLESLNMEVIGCKNRTLFNFSKSIVSFRLSNLKTLSLALGQNAIHDESLAKLLSACPVLEELTLSAKYFQAARQPIQIEAPNLLRLTLIPTPSKLQINCQKLEYLSLKSDANLTHLHIEAPSLISVRLYNIWRFRTFAQTLCDVTTVAITLSDKRLSDSTPRFLVC